MFYYSVKVRPQWASNLLSPLQLCTAHTHTHKDQKTHTGQDYMTWTSSSDIITLFTHIHNTSLSHLIHCSRTCQHLVNHMKHVKNICGSCSTPQIKRKQFSIKEKKGKGKKGACFSNTTLFFKLWTRYKHIFLQLHHHDVSRYLIIFQLPFDVSNYSNSIDYYFNALSN